VGLIFKKEHIRLILEGVKTQTRSRHKRPLKRGKIYDIKRDWYHSTGHKILVTDVYSQRLGDITPEEALKEGGGVHRRRVQESLERHKRVLGSRRGGNGL